MRVLKYSIISFIFLCILSFSTVVNASSFSESTGSYDPPDATADCPRCSWVFSSRWGGVRLGLYKYNGNGTPIKCGQSLELFNSTDRTHWSSIVTEGYSRFDYFYGGKEVNFKEGTIYGTQLTIYNEGNTVNFEKPWANGFIDNLVKYMGNENSDIKVRIKEMFGYNDFKEEEAAQYYISVEPTMGFKNYKRSIYVYGTAYEIMNAIYPDVGTGINDPYYTYAEVPVIENGETVKRSGWSFLDAQTSTVRDRMFNVMYVRQNSMKIYTQVTGSYDKYNFVNHGVNANYAKEALIVASGSQSRVSYDYIYAHYKEADFPFGITILWLKDVLTRTPSTDDDRTCKNYCEGLDGNALNNCAEQYCDFNDPNNPDCVMECQDIVYDSPGCDREYLNVCYNGDLKTSDIKSEGNYCAATGNTSDKTLTSKICYDDVSTTNNYKTESLFIRKGTSNVYVTPTSKTASISYYKIECDEAIKFTNLPARTSVHVSSSLTATLYAGYTMDYSKVCQIYYKTSDEKWTTDYNKSRAYDEIKKYSNRSAKEEDKGYIQIAEELIAKEKTEIKELEKKTNRTASEEANLKKLKEDVTRLEEVVKTLNEVVADLGTIKSSAEARLKSVKDKDQNGNLTNQIELEVSNNNATSSKKYTVTLEPVYCIANNSINRQNYCDLETKKGFSVDTFTNNVTCENSDGTAIKATVSNGKSYYYEKVHYSLPSSYTGVNEVGATVVCHDSSCAAGLDPSFEIKNAWVFDPLNQNVTLDAYNAITSRDDLKLVVKGMGSCGQFSYELNCGYEFESSKMCTENCIDKYNDPNSGMTEAEYNACFKKYCSCDSYCGSNVACRMKYCPQECEGCENIKTTENSCGDGCIDGCNKTYADHEDRLTCRYGCCRTSCNGEEGCIYNCCVDECNAKKENNYLTLEEHKQCVKMCSCENGSCPPDDSSGGRDYIYRTINLKRPFPNGDNPDGRTPGANWFGKVKYITDTEDVGSKYYDATDGVTEEYEYRFVLTSENIAQIKADENLNLTYTQFKESKEARNTYEDATKTKPVAQRADVYCSYIIHDYFKSMGINATSNAKDVRDKNIVGSGCYTR